MLASRSSRPPLVLELHPAKRCPTSCRRQTCRPPWIPQPPTRPATSSLRPQTAPDLPETRQKMASSPLRPHNASSPTRLPIRMATGPQTSTVTTAIAAPTRTANDLQRGGEQRPFLQLASSSLSRHHGRRSGPRGPRLSRRMGAASRAASTPWSSSPSLRLGDLRGIL